MIILLLLNYFIYLFVIHRKQWQRWRQFISKFQRLIDSHRNDFFQMDLKEGKNMTETWPPSPESRRRCRRRRPRVITHATRERESGLLFYEDVLALQRPPTPIVAVNGCSDDSAK